MAVFAKATAEPPGGYDYDFVQDIHNRFICSICTKVLKDPYLMVCCGQKYCHSCLQNWLKSGNNPNCPHCRANKKGLQPFQYVIERGMKSEIESFQILCSNSKEGCKWIGELRNLDGHLKSGDGCGYYKVICPNKCQQGSTTTKIHRKDLEAHLQLHCELRKIACQYCNKTVTVKSYPKHQRTCEMFPMECPNNCGEVGLVRQSIKAHRELCKFEAIDCQYASIGCEVKIKRRDMPQHLIDYQGHHLEKMTIVNDHLAEQVETLKNDAEEKATIVQKELSLAMHIPTSLLLSLKTQFQYPRRLDTETLYFRMLHFHQIESGQKDWFSPEFQCYGHVMKLHVVTERKTLHLELCLVKVVGVFIGSFTFTIKLLKPKLSQYDRRSFRNHRQLQATVKNYDDKFHYELNYPKAFTPTMDSHKVIQNWSLDISGDWDSHYIEEDTLLWEVQGTRNTTFHHSFSSVDIGSSQDRTEVIGSSTTGCSDISNRLIS